MMAHADGGAGEVVLHADCIARAFGGRRVLTAATLVLRAGRVAGLLGRMGEGKSTLLRICAGLLAADSGWVAFGGRRHLRPRHAELARAGLFALADAHTLLAHLPLGAQLALVARRFPGGALDRAVALLRLGDLLDRPPRLLSGGERRRADVAAALVRRPRCLLADEPFRGLDPISAELIGAAFRALAADGCAVVVTGHEVPTLVPWLDEIVWMTAGTTHHLGSPAEAWGSFAFRQGYLGEGLVGR